MNQAELDIQIDFDIAAVRRQPTFGDALDYGRSLAGKAVKKLCEELGIDTATYTRIKQDSNMLAAKKLSVAIQKIHNPAPLAWLVEDCGYDWLSVRKKQNEYEKQIEAERAERERLAEENRILRSLLGDKA